MEKEYDYTCPQCKKQLMNDDVMQEEVHVHYRGVDGYTDFTDYEVQYWCVECAEKEAVRTHKENGDTYYEYFSREVKPLKEDGTMDISTALDTLCKNMRSEYVEMRRNLIKSYDYNREKGAIPEFDSELMTCAEACMVLDWAEDWITSYIGEDKTDNLTPFEKELRKSVIYLLGKDKPLEYMVEQSMNTEGFDYEMRFSDIIANDRQWHEDYDK